MTGLKESILRHWPSVVISVLIGISSAAMSTMAFIHDMDNKIQLNSAQIKRNTEAIAQIMDNGTDHERRIVHIETELSNIKLILTEIKADLKILLHSTTHNLPGQTTP